MEKDRMEAEPQITNVSENVSKGSPSTQLMGRQIDVPSLEDSMEFPLKKKLKVEYDLAIPLLGIYPNKNTNLVRFLYRNVHSSIIYNSQET